VFAVDDQIKNLEYKWEIRARTTLFRFFCINCPKDCWVPLEECRQKIPFSLRTDTTVFTNSGRFLLSLLYLSYRSLDNQNKLPKMLLKVLRNSEALCVWLAKKKYTIWCFYDTMESKLGLKGSKIYCKPSLTWRNNFAHRKSIHQHFPNMFCWLWFGFHYSIIISRRWPVKKNSISLFSVLNIPWR